VKVPVRAEPRHEDNKLVRSIEGVPLSRLVAYFLRLGTVGFGGPIALVRYMQRDLCGRQALGLDRRLFGGLRLLSAQRLRAVRLEGRARSYVCASIPAGQLQAGPEYA